ncbi:hypothetical protein [Streptomyces sp. NPDC050738]|uniref:hypothetical protein n=1 Tax=Streptomyces sp. NPDC050738 TaxID=3154744 RepID=UPI00342B3C61
MNTGLKITAFAAAVAATFGTAYGVGKAVDPVVATERGHDAGAGHDSGSGSGNEHGVHEEQAAGGGASATGLKSAEGGYTLDLQTPTVAAGGSAEIRFAVKGKDGRNVTAYRREHGKELHFIVASRDLTQYRHLHPVRAADGTWSTPLRLPKAGAYRVFADFTPEAQGATGHTLGTGLTVSGKGSPEPLPPVRTTVQVDGYEVALAGALHSGTAGELRLTVRKDGRLVTDLQPYLGAYGHLVALRSGDLAYLHVHPNPGGPGPVVSFTATAPSEGRYRLFLDFQHEGKVRTAAFTVEAQGQAG